MSHRGYKKSKVYEIDISDDEEMRAKDSSERQKRQVAATLRDTQPEQPNLTHDESMFVDLTEDDSVYYMDNNGNIVCDLNDMHNHPPSSPPPTPDIVSSTKPSKNSSKDTAGSICESTKATMPNRDDDEDTLTSQSAGAAFDNAFESDEELPVSLLARKTRDNVSPLPSPEHHSSDAIESDEPTCRRQNTVTKAAAQDKETKQQSNKTSEKEDNLVKPKKEKGKRCNNCLGCKQLTCLEFRDRHKLTDAVLCVSCGFSKPRTCGFRPCVNLKTVKHKECEARPHLKYLTEDHLSFLRYVTVYGEESPFREFGQIEKIKEGQRRFRLLQEACDEPKAKSSRKKRKLQETPTAYQGVSKDKKPRRKGESKLKRTEVVDVGHRVFAEWPHDEGGWFWGKVAKTRFDQKKGVWMYSILFDDGDKCDLTSDKLYTEAEFRESEGLTESENIDGALRVGSKCYARFTDNQWYWGTIRATNGDGQNRRFHVLFDDGDTLDEVPKCDIRSGFEMKDDTDREFEPLKTGALREQRCGQCLSCLARECGRCKTCVQNLSQSCKGRENCLLRMCDMIDDNSKAQYVVDVAAGFEDCPDDLWRKTQGLRFIGHAPQKGKRRGPHSVSSQVTIVNDKGMKFTNLYSAMGNKKQSEVNEADKLCVYFYQRVLGLNVHVNCPKHALLGHSYQNRWLDRQGNVQEIFGFISGVTKSKVDDTFLFSVRLDDDFSRVIRAGGLGQAPKQEQYLAYHQDAATGARRASASAPVDGFTRIIHVPSPLTTAARVFSEQPAYPKTFTHNNFVFKMEVHPSLIPGAGWGLFLRCRQKGCPVDKASHSKASFELKHGEAIDLGVYAPHRKEDLKKEHISILKCFLFHGKCEMWYFGTEEKPGSAFAGHVFDITDDRTGELNCVASKCNPVYANETDGVAPASLFAGYDPSGSVHYYFGHEFKADGSFTMKANWDLVELKVDYGPGYEKVRVREGYPRVTGTELDELQQKLGRDDDDDVAEFKESSVTQIGESLAFLSRIFKTFEIRRLNKREAELDLNLLTRGVISTFLFQDRLSFIRKELKDIDLAQRDSFCDGGFTNTNIQLLANELARLSTHMCSLIPESDFLAIFQSDLKWRTLLLDTLDIEENDFCALSYKELKKKITCVGANE